MAPAVRSEVFDMKLRLDKYLADMGVGTRSEVKKYIKKGFVQVNGKTSASGDVKVDTDKDRIVFNGQPVAYVEAEYYMMNKPAGVVTATRDNSQPTVMDLLSDAKRKDLFPVGRLDKDTEGLLLITNDGGLAHELLSPRKHIPKVYYAKIGGTVTELDVAAFQEGVKLNDTLTAMPANLTVIKSGSVSEIEVEIFEGKFHQVKRMFEAVGKRVLYLKRISMGNLLLDENLKPGEYRKLTPQEAIELKQ